VFHLTSERLKQPHLITIPFRRCHSVLVLGAGIQGFAQMFSGLMVLVAPVTRDCGRGMCSMVSPVSWPPLPHHK